MKIEVSHYSQPAFRSARRGFTLIELMISIALVLLLILGVNQVFTYTTQAVGAGEAINAAIRSSRAAQAQMADDFSGVVPNGTGTNDSAAMIISSRAYYAFRDAKDQASQGATALNNSTGLPVAAFQDINGDGSVGDINVHGEVIYPSTYNYRNHRLDVLSFFSRGLFHRQTGNQGVFVDSLASQEAWIWYGHLHLPDNGGNVIPQDYPNSTSGVSTFPCMGPAASNPNNYFGGKLTLGRVAMLLLPKTGGVISDNQKYSQWYIDTSAVYPLSPFSPLAPMVTNGTLPQSPVETSAAYALCDSRVDLAATTISTFQQQLSSFISANPTTYWWEYMMDGAQNPSTAFLPNGTTRFKCNPFVAKPMTSQAMAMSSPFFLGGCSQFIVEFAGDFLTQDNDPSHSAATNVVRTRTNYGDVQGLASDGQIDFTVTYPSGPNGPPVKVIKWYGMPRGTAGNGSIIGANGDTVPVRDWLQNIYLPNGQAGIPPTYTRAPFEKGTLPAIKNDYSGSGGLTAGEAQTGYTCAFGPYDPHPKLIRVTITLDDPTGRLPDGLSYQYVFPVP